MHMIYALYVYVSQTYTCILNTTVCTLLSSPCEDGGVWSGRCNDVAAKGGTIVILGVNRGIAVQEQNGDLGFAIRSRHMEGSAASVPTV